MGDPNSHQSKSVSGDEQSQLDIGSSNSMTSGPEPGLIVDRVGDNETSEGPVREKLKKTSIASMPRQIEPTSNPTPETQEADPSIAQIMDSPAVPHGTSREGRGRPLKKRSFDDLQNDEIMQKPQDEVDLSSQSDRERKRSKELNGTRASEVEGQQQRSGTVHSGDQEPHANVPQLGSQSIGEKDIKNGDVPIPASSNTISTEQDMPDSTFSPRKKRSRDQLDAESQRDPKLPATDEAKAYRRSEEHERQNEIRAAQEDAASTSSSKNDIESHNDLATAQVNPSTVAKSPLQAPTSTASGNAESSSQSLSVSDNSSTGANAKAKGYDFSTSAFSTFSKSSQSPFGASGSTGTRLNSFASPTPLADEKSMLSGQAQQVSEQPSSSGLAGLSVHTNANTNGVGLVFGSNLNSTSQGTFGAFGGASPFIPSGASRLSSFAAPLSDNKGFGSGGPIKSDFGAKDSDDEKSGSDAEGEGERDFELEEEKTDPRFQYQEMDTGEEGEDSVFTSGRARLLGFEERVWKERGSGTLKLNVATSYPEASETPLKKARFIMRAHQTFRVLLNSPVLKEMKIDYFKTSKKSLNIGVWEDGKLTPYLITLHNDVEAKTLLEEVKRVKEQLQ